MLSRLFIVSIQKYIQVQNVGPRNPYRATLLSTIKPQGIFTCFHGMSYISLDGGRDATKLLIPAEEGCLLFAAVSSDSDTPGK